jgi:hypothetical protein
MNTDLTQKTNEELMQELSYLTNEKVEEMENKFWTSATLKAEVRATATRYHAIEAELQRRGVAVVA